MGENYEVPNIEGLEYLPRHVRDLFYEDPHAQDENGDTVLHKHAARGVYYHIMTPRLITQAFDLEIENNYKRTAFLHAVFSCNRLMMEAFIEKGANVHTKDLLNQNALHYLLLSCRISRWYTTPFLESLLEKGVDVNCQNKYGYTPLMWASAGYDLKIVKLLLNSKYGANVHLTNLISQTCLHMASTSLEWGERNSDIITELIRNGACVNCFDYEGRTPLGYVLCKSRRNKHYLAKKFLTAACLANSERRNDFYISDNQILGEGEENCSLVQHVSDCYDEIGLMSGFQLSEGFDLCQFALRGVSDVEESIASEIRDAVQNILVQETFPIYHDFIFSINQLDYLQGKVRELDIFTYRRGRKISLIPDVNSHIALFLDINGLLGAFKAFSRETLL